MSKFRAMMVGKSARDMCGILSINGEDIEVYMLESKVDIIPMCKGKPKMIRTFTLVERNASPVPEAWAVSTTD